MIEKFWQDLYIALPRHREWSETVPTPWGSNTIFDFIWHSVHVRIWEICFWLKICVSTTWSIWKLRVTINRLVVIHAALAAKLQDMLYEVPYLPKAEPSHVTYLLTPWCRVLLGKLTRLQLVKIFPKFHWIRRFITALTSVRHLSLSWTSPIQSIYPHPTSWRSVLILSTHIRLCLPSILLPSGFPTKNLYSSFSSSIRATCPAHLILLDFIIRTKLG